MAKRFLYNHFFRYVLAIFPRLQYTEFGSAPDPEHLQDMRKYVAIWFSWFGHTFWRKVYLTRKTATFENQNRHSEGTQKASGYQSIHGLRYYI